MFGQVSINDISVKHPGPDGGMYCLNSFSNPKS